MASYQTAWSNDDAVLLLNVIVRRWFFAYGVMLGALTLPASSRAQVARIHVTRATDQLPIAGAMVSLARVGDTSAVARLTDTSGVTVLRASAPARYHVIARRIGYTPADTTISISGGVVDVILALIDARTVLNPIVVEDKTSCVASRDAGQRVFQLWNAVRNALEINKLTESQELVRMEIEQYERDLTPNLTERSKKTQRKQEATRQPFAAASPQFLETVGYVSRGDLTYFAPDARTLLSDAFARSHCFSLVPAAKNEKKLVGLAFAPTPERRQPDVSGILWLDASTLALDHLVFSYVNDPSPIQAAGSGGRVDFAQLRDGAWIIPRWYIRTPRLGQVRRANAALGRVEVTDTLLGFREAGAVAHVLARGEHPVLAASQEVTSTKTDAASAVPLHTREPMCADSGPAGNGITLYGRVSDQAGVLDPAVRLFVSWSKPDLHVIGKQVAAGQQGQLIEVQPDSEGRYALCSLPVAQEFRLELKKGLAKLDEKIVVAPDTAARIETNLRAGSGTESSTHGVARKTLLGTVLVEGTVNEGVNDAEVIMADLRTRTDRQGHFRLDGIGRNSQTIHIRRVGFFEYEGKADLSAGDSLSARFFLRRMARKVDTIFVESTKPWMEEFESRRKRGSGSFLTRADLAKKEAKPLSEILADVSGLNVVRMAGGAAAVATRRTSGSIIRADTALDAADRRRGARPACYTQVFLDGVRVFTPGDSQPLFDVNSLNPSAIEAIEYYRSSAETPAKYSSPSASCGTLLIWTRR
jgi:hypothetical protein